MAVSKLVDIHGNPFRLEQEPQTENNAMIGMVMQQYSEHPSAGITPSRAATLLRDAESGIITAQCELAEDMEEKDTHLFSELGKRRRALLPIRWNIKPPDGASEEEKRDADMIEAVLRSFTWLTDFIFDATDAIHKGFSCQEYTGWERVDGIQMPKGIQWQDPAIFQIHPQNRNELRLRDGSYDGIALSPFGWVQHRAKSKSGYLARIGLVRTLIWPFIFKNYSLRDLAEFLEIYGIPIKLGKYPEGATPTEKATLLRAVLSIGHNAGGIIPRGMEIDFQSAADGAADPFQLMIDWGERSMSKAILGGTLTSQADGKTSTNALGDVHNDARLELRDSDLQQLASTITRDIVYPLYVLNGKSYRTPRRMPVFEFDTTRGEDLTEFSLAIPRLVRVGVQIPEQWIHDKLKIPVPSQGETILAPVVTDGGQAELRARSERERLAVLAAQKTPAPMDAQAQMDAAMAAIGGDEWARVMMPVLRPVIASIIKEGPVAALNNAAALFPQMDESALTELLTNAMFVADTLGRLHAESEQ